MAMISMKTEGGDDYPEISRNPYGYGLCISLSEEQVEALGLDKLPPQAGSKVGITAIAIVRRVTSESDPSEEVAEGENATDIDVSLELQITDLEVKPSGLIANNASMLYGS